VSCSAWRRPLAWLLVSRCIRSARLAGPTHAAAPRAGGVVLRLGAARQPPPASEVARFYLATHPRRAPLNIQPPRRLVPCEQISRRGSGACRCQAARCPQRGHDAARVSERWTLARTAPGTRVCTTCRTEWRAKCTTCTTIHWTPLQRHTDRHMRYDYSKLTNGA
jgi:hypothetical protein